MGNINRLTALQVQKLSKPGYHADGAGLHLCVKATGGKSWIFRYRYGGKEREMGLGPLHTVSLAEAREKALAQRKMLLDGVDPLAAKHASEVQRKLAEASVITFDTAATSYIASHRAGWKNEKHAEQWTNTLTTYASPVFGSLPVADITTPLVLRVLEPIWTTKTETASRVRGRVEKILDWCKTQGYRTGDNPAAWRGHLENLLSAPQKTKKVEHHPALPWREIGAFMQALRTMPGAAALATVLRYAFGRPLGELDVMKGMLVGADPATVQQYGFSMLDMKRFVQGQGLRASGFLADKTRLAQLRIPVITLIDSGGYKHFVVIRRVQNDEVHLADPAMGNRSMPLEDFARQWNGVLLAVAGPGYQRDTPLLQPRRVFSARTSINNSQPVPIAELLEFGFQHSDFF